MVEILQVKYVIYSILILLGIWVAIRIGSYALFKSYFEQKTIHKLALMRLGKIIKTNHGGKNAEGKSE